MTIVVGFLCNIRRQKKGATRDIKDIFMSQNQYSFDQLPGIVAMLVDDYKQYERSFFFGYQS